MKNYLFCLLVLVATACNEDNEIVYSVDPELQPYVNTFYTEAAERNVVIPKNLIAEIKAVQSAAQVDTQYGQNYLYFDPINLDYYVQNAGERFIEAHIYNRLGGLFLKRSPSTEYSFMNPEVRYGGYNPDDKEALFDELFQIE